MTIAYTPKDAALDVVAIALILAPEPLTTPIGISLLLRKRGSSAQHEPTVHHRHYYPEYTYRVDTIRGRQITWEVRTLMPGQLPMKELNRPDVKIKPREEYIRSATTAEKSSIQKVLENLPPGVKVHHTVYRPSRAPATATSAFIPGETIHHTLRQLPAGPSSFSRSQPTGNIHHTIEDSPGYIIARSGAASPVSQPAIIHHTLRPAVQHGNPANIVKPVHIIEHHTLNPTPPVKFRGRLIQPSEPRPSVRITGKYPGRP